MKHIVLLLFVSLLSCTQRKEQGGMDIIIEVNNEFDINDNLLFQFIPLETTDTSLFGDVGNILIHHDTIYIIDSKNTKLLTFNMKGEFIAQIGEIGNGPGEYVSPVVMHIDDKRNVISVADPNLCKLLNYSLDDFHYLNSHKIGYFSECCWLPDGNIVWMFPMGYETDSKESFQIKVTDTDLKELNFLFPISYKYRSLMRMGTFFYIYKNNCFLNLPYSSTVYQVFSHKVMPYYHLDVKGYDFPSEEWMHQNATEDYATSILKSGYISACNVKESDDYLSINYFANGHNGFLGFYNKKTQKSCLYSAPDFIKKTGLTGAGWIKGTYKDYFVMPLSALVLKRYGSKIPALNDVAEKINEDDNPVLCLFKFK